jgi:regulator of sigma E protease
LGAFVRIKGEEGGVDDLRSVSNLKIWKRVLIVIGGVVAFWITAMVIFSVVFSMGATLPVGDQEVQGLTNPQVKVISVADSSPAFAAGLQVKDTIKGVKVDGLLVDIDKISQFQEVTLNNAGKELVVVVKRGEESFDFALTPRENPPAGQGAVGIGIERMATLIEKTPWYLAPIKGITYTYEITARAIGGIYQTIANLFTRQDMPEGFTFAGPIGITIFLANAASYGAGFFLYFIGVISVLVAIFNILPIPALDGGKLIFLIIEKIKGSPISVKVEQWITVSFFLILIGLSVFITIRFDLPRLYEFIKQIF